MNIFISIIILIVVVAFVIWIAEHLCKPAVNLENKARQVVRGRMLRREKLTNNEFEELFKAPLGDESKKYLFLEVVSRITDIDKFLFRPDDVFSEVFKISRTDLKVTEKEWDQAGLKGLDSFEVFIEEMYEYLELNTNMERWKMKYSEPATRAASVNLLSNTDLNNLLNLMSPLLKRRKTGVRAKFN